MSSFASGYIKYINHIEQINDAALINPEKMITEIEESYHEHLHTIANNIINQKNKIKVCMIAGPSSSGKTTTATFLCKYLRELGKNATIVSLDNFYLDNNLTPKRKDGTKDFETINSLDIKAIKECIKNILEGKDFEVPEFNFEQGKPIGYNKHNLVGDDIVILEGIHGLNPIFTSGLDETSLIKLYVSVKQDIKDANGIVMTAEEIRLTRRIVRDIQFRACSPEKTIDMWPNVMEGEDKYIRPYRMSADYTVNSIHIYEPCVLRSIAIPLMRKIAEYSDYYRTARALEAKLMRFEPISCDLVPNNSVLREFIG